MTADLTMCELSTDFSEHMYLKNLSHWPISYVNSLSWNIYSRGILFYGAKYKNSFSIKTLYNQSHISLFKQQYLRYSKSQAACLDKRYN